MTLLAPALDTGHWTDDAASLGLDVNIFFPELGNRYSPARRICAACPVVADCRKRNDRAERGLPLSHLFGMFGGETPAERFDRRSRAVP